MSLKSNLKLEEASMKDSKANGNGTQLTQQERYKIRNLLMELKERPPLNPQQRRRLLRAQTLEEAFSEWERQYEADTKGTHE